MKHIGFTGTRHGMTAAQLHRVSMVIELELDDLDIAEPPAFWAHHGDCEGGDCQFHHLVRERFSSVGALIEVHPGPDGLLRAHCEGDLLHPPLPHMKRNQAIVDVSPIMIGAPRETTEQWHGDTWATIRMARRAIKRERALASANPLPQHSMRRLYVVSPDGSIHDADGRPV